MINYSKISFHFIKLIVATDPEQVTLLDGLYKRGLENGVKDLRVLASNEIRDIEPNCVVSPLQINYLFDRVKVSY